MKDLENPPRRATSIIYPVVAVILVYLIVLKLPEGNMAAMYVLILVRQVMDYAVTVSNFIFVQQGYICPPYSTR